MRYFWRNCRMNEKNPSFLHKVTCIRWTTPALLPSFTFMAFYSRRLRWDSSTHCPTLLFVGWLHESSTNHTEFFRNCESPCESILSFKSSVDSSAKLCNLGFFQIEPLGRSGVEKQRGRKKHAKYTKYTGLVKIIDLRVLGIKLFLHAHFFIILRILLLKFSWMWQRRIWV